MNASIVTLPDFHVACIVVPPDLSPDPEISVKDVPGGSYAVSKYVGTAGEIGKAWGPGETALEHAGFRVHAEYLAEHVADLTHCGVRAHGVQDMWHGVLRALRRVAQLVQTLPYPSVITPGL